MSSFTLVVNDDVVPKKRTNNFGAFTEIDRFLKKNNLKAFDRP